MTHQVPQEIQRHSDVLVIGGSAAGLAAALQLGRQRRSVIVVDASEPRNAPAAEMHGFLGRDGTPPSDLLDDGRAEVRTYGGEVLMGRVVTVTRADDRFLAELTGGHSVAARAVVVATGLVDELPEIDGVAEQWGRGVLHCPFCHGDEIRDRRVVQIVTHPMGLHPTPLFRQLTGELTVVVHDDTGVDPERLDVLAAAGVEVIRSRVAGVRSDADGSISHVELDTGVTIPADAVVVMPRFSAATDALAGLGLDRTAHPSGIGDILAVDDVGSTSVPGVWAAGNVTDPNRQVLQAAADGARVGAMVAVRLAEIDLADGARTSSNEEDWDRRYGGDRIWSGNPNGALVAEIDGGEPGTALDVGAGEGGDAIWLAEQGWTVTASDISSVGLEHVRTEAERRGLDLRFHRCDANAPDAFGEDRFDLVSAHYASIPRTADGRAVANITGAVAPGGTLLVVGHDAEPMRRPVDPATTSRAFDPDAYVRVEDVAAALADDPDWVIEVHETRPRPPGSASASHHVNDAVLRARRVGA